MRDGIETSVFLTDGQAKQTLGGFYRSVAKLAGHEETDDTMYPNLPINYTQTLVENLANPHKY